MTATRSHREIKNLPRPRESNEIALEGEQSKKKKKREREAGRGVRKNKGDKSENWR